jgi:hypothetical protein
MKTLRRKEKAEKKHRKKDYGKGEGTRVLMDNDQKKA